MAEAKSSQGDFDWGGMLDQPAQADKVRSEQPRAGSALMAAGKYLVGICLTLLLVGGQTVNNGAAGSALLAVPFLDVTTGAGVENADLQSGAGLPGVSILSLTSRLQGVDINASYNVTASNTLHLGLIGGFRYLNLREDLAFPNVGVVTNAALATPIFGGTVPFVGEVNDTVDQFSTRNDFYGGQFGVRADLLLGNFFVNVAAKLALGDVQESLTINGAIVTNATGGFTTPAASTVVPGGIFAQQTNIGHYLRDCFAVAPELNVKVGYQLANLARLSAGYDLLYLSSVARPGNQIDRAINTNQFVDYTGLPLPAFTGPSRPAFLGLKGSDFWAQGITFGLEFSY